MAYCAKCGREIMEGRQLCDLCMVEMQRQPRLNVNIPMIIGIVLCGIAVASLFLPFMIVPMYNMFLFETEYVPWGDASGWAMLISIAFILLGFIIRHGAIAVAFSIWTIILEIGSCTIVSKSAMDKVIELGFSKYSPYPTYGAVILLACLIGTTIVGFIIKKKPKNKNL